MAINLPAALQSQLTIGGSTIETDASAAVSSITVNYQTKIATITVQQGTVSGSAFSPGQYPPSYQFNVNLTTGVWTVNGSALSGTLTGSNLTNAQTTFMNLRNTEESFAVAQNLFPSATLTAWISI